MKYKAVVFDMDGLLIESEKIAIETFREACNDLGLEFDLEIYKKLIGTNEKRTVEILSENYGSDFPLGDFLHKWSEKYHRDAYGKPVPLRPGVKELLQFLKNSGIPIALATSTDVNGAQQKLTNAKIREFFPHIVGGDQVENSKPDPEIYLKAAKKLNIDPKDCLALEDSDAGVRSANAAGMTVIQIPDIAEPAEDVKPLSLQIMPSLIQVLEHIKNPN